MANAQAAQVRRPATHTRRLPRRVGAVELDDSPARLVLDDFADALAAYVRIAARTMGEDPRQARLPLERFSFDGTLSTRDADDPRLDAQGGGDASKTSHPALDQCDTVVVSAAAVDICPGATAAEALRRLAELGLVAPGTRVGAIVASDDWDASAASATCDALRAACDAAGLVWIGGVAVGGGALIPRLMKSPRLGMWRRPLSEAVDRLIAAVRMGCTLGELAELTMDYGETELPRDRADATAPPDAGAITVHAPLPRWLYARLMGHLAI